MNVIPEQPETGPGLADLSRSGGARQTVRLAEPTHVKRTEFFFATPGPYPTANFGFMLTDPAQRDYVGQELIVCNLKRVTVPGESGVVLQDGLVVPDTLHHLNPWARGSLLATFEPTRWVRFKRPLAVMHKATQGSYFVGFTGSWRNYAHWLQESLPKLTAFVEMRRTRPELKLVVPKFPPGSFHQQTLTLLGITRAMVFPLEFEDVITFDDAWVASHPHIWSVPPFVAAAARQLASGVVQEFASDEPGGSGQGDRIYLHRRDTTRCVANFTEVEALVKRHGFTVVSPEQYPVAQQIAIMQRARCVIAEHGAGAANILFCRPGASVLELFNPSSVQPAYWSVASACELRFGFVVGEHVNKEEVPNPNWNSEYIIPKAMLEEAIFSMASPVGRGAYSASHSDAPAESMMVPREPAIGPSLGQIVEMEKAPETHAADLPENGQRRALFSEAFNDAKVLSFEFWSGGNSSQLDLSGFSSVETLGRWAIGCVSRIIVPIASVGYSPVEATLIVNPCVVAGVIDAQRLNIFVNGVSVYSSTISVQSVIVLDLTDIGNSLGDKLTFELRHPDAASPSAGGRSSDVRRLAIFLQSLKILLNPKAMVSGPPGPVMEAAISKSDLPEVHQGRDGWLFLIKGSNNVIDFYTTEDAFTERDAHSWADQLVARSNRFAADGIRYRHIVAPDKLSVYPNYTTIPLPFFDRHPLRQLSAAMQKRGVQEILINPLARFLSHPRRDEIYRKTDTHWSYFGGMVIVELVAQSLGRSDLPTLDSSRIQFADHSGDLGSKLASAPLERFARVTPLSTVSRVHANELALLFERNAPAGKPVLHHGIHVVFKNSAPEAIEETIVIFGDSFIDFQPSNPIMAFAETFRETHFIWSADIDFAYPKKVGATVVISELAERFMRSLSFADDFDAEAEASRRFQEFDVKQ